MKRGWLILLLFVLAAVSWIRWPLISSGIVSLSCWLVLSLGSPGSHWSVDPRLIEYWVATLVWIMTVGTVLLRLFKNGIRSERLNSSAKPSIFLMRSPAQVFMGLSIYVAFVCPLIAPMDPNAQGDLLTTRLLPPFSRGGVVDSLPQSPGDPAAGPIEKAYDQAITYLLFRQREVYGGDRAPDGPIDVRRSSPMIFVLGTDDVGRDVLSRVLYGVRTSLGVGLLASLGAVILGVFVGLVSGMFPGFLDSLLMRVTDLILSLPVLLLVIGSVAFVGQSWPVLLCVLSFTGWMGIARLVRAEVHVLREREFVLTARLLRVPVWKIMTRHLLPHLVPVVVTTAVLQFGNIVLAEAALGFLGLGLQPPTASLGNMMGEATSYLEAAWWVGVFPGAMLAALLVSSHFAYDRLLRQLQTATRSIEMLA